MSRQSALRVAMATSAGRPGQANEDYLGAVPGVVVLLDGAGIPGAESVCRHGVVWFTRRLGGALLERLAEGRAPSLVDVLAEAIDQLAGEHRETCDVADPSSPQATVAVVRIGLEHIDYLLLADSHLLLGRAHTDVPEVVTDEREVVVRQECTMRLAGLEPGSRDYEAALPACIENFRSRRNQPGGYWIAKDDPQAAEAAVTGAVPLVELTDFMLLSNGVTRLVHPFDVATWTTLLEHCRTEGSAAVLEQLRGHEAQAEFSGSPDDATVAHVVLR